MLLKSQGKKLWKFFVILFFINFLIINWNEISWVFNYHAFLGQLSSFFQREEARGVGTKEISSFAKTTEGKGDTELIKAIKATEATETSEGTKEIKEEKGIEAPKETSTFLEIPEIEIEAPIVFIDKDCEKENCDKDYGKALKKGVLHYPESPFLEKGEVTIILGHSAPPNWPKIYYDWIFNDLNSLAPGDEVYIYFEKEKYVFLVQEKFFLEVGQDVPTQALTESETMLVLISCWPPGRDSQRIAVSAKLINN